MPTSVLLAVLAAAGLLALAPALVRRYDAAERLVAERALSTARVVCRAGSTRYRRRRTVPGRRPINSPYTMVQRVPNGQNGSAETPGPNAATASASDSGASATGGSESAGLPGESGQRKALLRVLRPISAIPVSGPAHRGRARRSRAYASSRAMYRRRRVLLALVLFNIVELVGVVFVGPGFWIGTGMSASMLAGYLVHLRNRALADQRRRKEEARYAAWLAARQAAIRREQARRAAARRAAVEEQLAERDRLRREAIRLAAVRGRPYSSRASGQ